MWSWISESCAHRRDLSGVTRTRVSLKSRGEGRIPSGGHVKSEEGSGPRPGEPRGQQEPEGRRCAAPGTRCPWTPRTGRQKEREAAAQGAQGAWLLSAGGRRARGRCRQEHWVLGGAGRGLRGVPWWADRGLNGVPWGAQGGRPRPEQGAVGGTEEAGAGSASRGWGARGRDSHYRPRYSSLLLMLATGKSYTLKLKKKKI